LPASAPNKSFEFISSLSRFGLRRYTPERSAAIAEVLSREYMRPDGKMVRVSSSQLYKWLKRYENGLLEGIRPRQRKDIGQRRVLISRKWDRACPLDGGKK
jgi:transposase-like protein